jgi:predicted transcriptional regulator
MQKTKHDIVLATIEKLAVGDRVSVRQLARQMNISEGTVYRAIKDAERQGLVKLLPKVGTVRIEQVKERRIDTLTYGELVGIVEGRLLHGEAFRDQAPKTFFVATSLTRLEEKAPRANSMIICDFDKDILDYAQAHGLSVMLVDASDLTQRKTIDALPEDAVVMSTPYAIFDAISAINQAIATRVQGREMMTVGDIMTTAPYVLHGFDTVRDWKEMVTRTGHSRFPVVDAQGRLEGLVTAYDVSDMEASTYIDDCMMPNPVTVHSDVLVSYLGRLFVLEGVDLVPVVDENHVLQGVVSRKDVIEVQQSMQKQPHLGDTTDNIIMSGFSLVAREPEVILRGSMGPFMVDEYGMLSLGACTVFAANAAVIALRIRKDLQAQANQAWIHIYAPVRPDDEVFLFPVLSENAGHWHATVRVETADGQLAAVGEVDMIVK